MSKKLSTVVLAIGALIFFVLYTSQMGNALWHDELIATDFFHKYGPFSPSPDGYNPKSMMDFSKNWKAYLRIYPPGFISFYQAWSVFSSDNPYLLRVPLLILCFFALFRFFKTLNLFFSKSEASLYTAFFSLSPLWYGQGLRLNPESFTLCFSIISFSYFFQIVQLKEYTLKKRAFNYFTGVNALWLFFDYFALIPHLVQCSVLIFSKQELSKKKVYFLTGIAILSYVIIFALTTGFEGPNPFTFKWAQPEIINIFKIFQFISVGKIYE